MRERQIRPMRQEDLDAAAVLERETFSLPWSRQSFADALSNPAACYVTALQNGEVVGYCGFWQSLDEAEITNVAVAPAFRGQGIAQDMLRHLLQCGAERGAAHYTLEVRVSNLPALRLYEKLGFVSAGIRPGFYECPREDARILWLHTVP